MHQTYLLAILGTFLGLALGRGGFANAGGLSSQEEVAQKEVAGVKLPDTIKVGEQTLKLNGLGLRTRYFIKAKVYVAGLYLEKPSKDAATVISSDQIKRVHLTFLRDLDRSKITEAIGEGFARNSKAQMNALKERLEKLKSFIPDVDKGEQLVITYLP